MSETVYENCKPGIKITILRDKLAIDATQAKALTGEWEWEYLDRLRASLRVRLDGVESVAAEEKNHRYALAFISPPTQTEDGSALFDKLTKELAWSIGESISTFGKPLLLENGGTVECVFVVRPGVAS